MKLKFATENSTTVARSSMGPMPSSSKTFFSLLQQYGTRRRAMSYSLKTTKQLNRLCVKAAWMKGCLPWSRANPAHPTESGIFYRGNGGPKAHPWLRKQSSSQVGEARRKGTARLVNREGLKPLSVTHFAFVLESTWHQHAFIQKRGRSAGAHVLPTLAWMEWGMRQMKVL